MRATVDASSPFRASTGCGKNAVIRRVFTPIPVCVCVCVCTRSCAAGHRLMTKTERYRGAPFRRVHRRGCSMQLPRGRGKIESAASPALSHDAELVRRKHITRASIQTGTHKHGNTSKQRAQPHTRTHVHKPLPDLIPPRTTDDEGAGLEPRVRVLCVESSSCRERILTDALPPAEGESFAFFCKWRRDKAVAAWVARRSAVGGPAADASAVHTCRPTSMNASATRTHHTRRAELSAPLPVLAQT